MSTKLVCTNCKRKYKISRWHTRVPTRCQDCGGMLSGDLTLYYKHIVAHPTRYNGPHKQPIRPLAKVAGIAFLFGVLMTAVLFTWHRNTQVPRLMTQLHSEDEDVWTAAMEDLISVGQRAVPALVGAVAGEDETLSERALRTLERLGDKALEPLVELMVRRDERLSGSAAGLLPRLSSRQTLPRLESLYVSQTDLAARSAMLEVFERYPEMQFFPTLVNSLSLPVADEGTQTLNHRVDRLLRRILEETTGEDTELEVPQPPTQVDEWPAWLQEHQEEINVLMEARRADRDSVTEAQSQ